MVNARYSIVCSECKESIRLARFSGGSIRDRCENDSVRSSKVLKIYDWMNEHILLCEMVGKQVPFTIEEE